MHWVITIAFAVLAVGVFLWLISPDSRAVQNGSSNPSSSFIDPDDSYQIALLVGMTGGSAPDAATMRFALDRFQSLYGRRATTVDIGIVLGLIKNAS